MKKLKLDKNVYKAVSRVGNVGLNYAAKAIPFPKAKTVTGPGCRKEIPRVLKELGITRLLFVTDKYLGEHVAPEIIDILVANDLHGEIYDRVCQNPTSDVVYEIRDMYIKEKCDGFLAIGGGGPIDATKAAAALIARPNATVPQLGGLFKVMKKVPPILVAPTTSGTGSETTFAAVITDSSTRHKFAIMDPALTPTDAIMDPELLVSLPPKLTATTGMDALTHAVESYICWTNKNVETDAFAEDAVALIFRYLERAYNKPDDIEAREMMMEAAYKAGWSFGRAGVGNVHAIAHTFGGMYDVPHGLANAVILPIVLEEYGDKIYNELATLALITGVKVGGTSEEKAKAFINEIYAMNERMGIPKTLPLKDEDIPQLVEWAMAEVMITYPVPVIFDSKQMTRMFKKIQSK